jgi:hypothetical protein
MSKSKLFVASALALVGVLGTGVARANHDDVQWSVTIGTPIGVPVYTQPAPVYQHSYPSQYPPQYYPQHRQYYPQHRSYYYGQPSRWDRDGDGIPNRRDRVYNPRWDRDGDGVPNRYDRDRDGDGIPNWHDRRDNRHWRGR